MSQEASMTAAGAAPKPTLKDPLQREQTAYEILGLARGAGDAEVQKAFGLGIAKRGDPKKLTSAKRILQTPAECVLLDLFHYLPEWADRLAPNACQQPAVLDLVRRGSTAQAWENQLRMGFPDVGAAHSLAVLWYWWAVWEEEQSAGAKKSAAVVSVDQMWQKAIACWAMVICSDNFWSGAGIGQDLAHQVGAAVVDRLNGRLREFGQKHRENRQAGVAAGYQELELALTTELRTAKQLGRSGIRTARGKVVCGLLMLEQVGLLEEVRKQIETGLQRSPSSENLGKLRDALSPYASIAALISDNRPQAALDALARQDQADVEVKALRAKALHSLAKQQTSLNNMDDALGSWEQALECRPSTELKSNILAEIVSSCQTKAAALQQHQPGVAIALLERALRLADHTTLKLLLAETLTIRGISVMNEAQRRLAPDGAHNAVQIRADLKKGLDDLERAAKLGSRRAGDQLEAARKFYEQFAAQVESGFIYLTKEGAELVAQAHEAATNGRLDDAIQLLQTALSRGNEKSTLVKKQLAQLLTARGVQQVNAATNAAQQLRKDEEKEQRKKVKSFFLTNGAFGWVFSQLGIYAVVGASAAAFNSAGPFWDRLEGAGILSLGAVVLLIVLRWISRKVVAKWRAFMLETRALTMGNRYFKVHDTSELMCDVCFQEPKYSMSVPGRSTCRLCEGHADALRSIVGTDATASSFTRSAIEAAIEDVAEAVRLDPEFSHAQDTLKQLREMLGQFPASQFDLG